MADDSWRCFIAVRIDEAHRTALAGCVEQWSGRPELSALRWTAPETWHVTLAFLGSTAPADVPRVVSAATAVTATVRPARLTPSALGAFPVASRARVAWQGIEDQGRLAEVAHALASALGVAPESRFRPHLTLARARGAPVDLRGWLADPDPLPPPMTMVARHAVLFRSHLGQGGPRHEEIAVLPFGGDRG